MYYHGGNIYDYENIKYDFSSNINPLGLPCSFKKALSKNLDLFTRYPDIQSRELIKSLGKYLNITDSYILLGNGAIELIYKIIDSIGFYRLYTIMPTFCEYKRAALNRDMKFYEIEVYNEEFTEFNIDRFLKEIEEKSLVVLCNPNNPTGSYINNEEMAYIAEILRDKGCYLIIDECFIEFTEDYPASSFVDRAKDYENVIIIKALTKYYGMPGIRLGYGITKNEGLYKKVRKNQYPWNINTAGIIAGCTVLKDEEYIMKSRNWIKEERQFLYEGLSEVSFLKPIPSKANFHLVKIKDESLDSYRLRDALSEEGILIRVADGFSSLDSSYFRLAVLDSKANSYLLEALKKIL